MEPGRRGGSRLTDRAFSYAWVVSYTQRRRVIVSSPTAADFAAAASASANQAKMASTDPAIQALADAVGYLGLALQAAARE